MAAAGFNIALDSFARWMRVERNLAPRTRTAYEYELRHLHEWLAAALGREEVRLRDITHEHLHAYLAYLRDEKAYKPSTQTRIIAAVNAFFAYCQEGELIQRNPAEDLARPKMPQKLPIYLTEEEVHRVFDAPDTSSPGGRRDRAILVTLAQTGLRLQELVGLNTLDIDFARKSLRVMGKGSKERLVPMNASVEQALRTMLEDSERVVTAGEKAVFLNARGKRLSGRAVEYMVDKYVAAAGIGRDNVSPHKLRHTFATMLHGKDVELIDIQALMGHASLASTQIYTHTQAERLRGAVDRLGIEGLEDL